jgi:hypothetical protein
MDAVLSEVVSVLNRLGLTDLLQKDSTRCRLRFNNESQVFYEFLYLHFRALLCCAPSKFEKIFSCLCVVAV